MIIRQLNFSLRRQRLKLAPVRRMIQDARDGGRVIDATCGHKTRAVLVMDSEHVILSPLLPETVAARIDERKDGEENA